MKNLCRIIFLLGIFALSGCSNDEEFNNPDIVKIEKEYPFFLEKADLNNLNAESVELFKQKIYIINSIEDLNDCLVSNYFSDETRKDFFACDFNKYTLLLASSVCLYEVEDMEHHLIKDKKPSEYIYRQVFYANIDERDERYLYFIGSAFAIKKINSDSRFGYWTGTPVKKSSK